MKLFSTPLAALRMNLSFSACGFLGIYHLGVADALLSNGKRLLPNVQRYSGASAGACVAAILAIQGNDAKKHLEVKLSVYLFK